MKFSRLLTRNFAGLPDDLSWEFATQGITFVLGPNEAGKSTLMQALLAALYGEPVVKKRGKSWLEGISAWHAPDKVPETELHVQSVLHSATGVNLLPQDFLIHRLFKDKSSPANLKVQDAYTRKVVTDNFVLNKKQSAVGEMMTGLSYSNFTKAVWISQNAMQDFSQDTSDVTQVVQAIEKVVQSSETGTTAQSALNRLKAAQSQFNPDTGSKLQLQTSINRLKKEIIGPLLSQKSKLEEEYAQYQSAFATVDALKEEQKELRHSLKTQQRVFLHAERAQLQTQLAADDALLVTIEKLLAERDALSVYRDFPAERLSKIQGDAGQFSLMQAELDTLSAITPELEEAVKHSQAAVTDIPSWIRNFMPEQKLEIEAHLHHLKRLLGQLEENADALKTESARLQTKEVDLEKLTLMARIWNQYSESDRMRLGVLSHQLDRMHADLTTQSESLRKTDEAFGQEQLRAQRKNRIIAGISVLAIILGIGFAIYTGPTTPTIALMGLGLIFAGLFLNGYYSLRDKRNAHHALLDSSRERENSDNGAQSETEREWHQLIESIQPASWPGSGHEVETALWWLSKRDSEAKHWIELFQQLLGLIQSWNQGISVFTPLLEAESTVISTRQFFSETLMTDMPEIKAALSHLENSLSRSVVAEKALLVSQENLQRHTQQLETRRQQVNDAKMQIAALLQHPLISEELDWPEKLAEFEASVLKKQQLESLELQLNAKTEHLLLPEQRSALSQALSAFPESMETDETLLTEDLSVVKDRIRGMQHRLETVNEEINRLGLSLYRHQDNYLRHYPEVLEKLETAEANLAKYEAFQSALNLAADTLEQVSQQEFRSWSGYLNTSVNDALQILQSPYTDIRFDTDLGFSLMDSNRRDYRSGERFERLSTGTKDLLYLAIRMGINDYLSSPNNPLPLILDDPFVNFDDSRFAQGLRALCLAAAQGRQILVFSCHESRHLHALETLQPEFKELIHIQTLSRSTSAGIEKTQSDKGLRVQEIV